MRMKKLLLFPLLLLNLCSYAQEVLKTGFSMLETGRFAEAAVFFKHYLNTEDSTNKTALICYGRAIGLSGNVPEAKTVFKRLANKYPGDFEIELNAAEALMWGKEFMEAKQVYQALLQKYPDNFPANLGYGNALSSLFTYDTAIVYINKALALQPGNANALISRKYARLGLADQYAKRQEYNEAAPLLDAIFTDFPDDKEALFSKGQLKIMQGQYMAATAIYKRMLEKKQDSVNAFLSLSYISFLQKKKKTALIYADKAIAAATDSATSLKARLGRITALGWNEKFKQAFIELDSLEQQYPGNPDVTIRRAGLLTWNKQYTRSVSLFKSALARVPYSFDANLGTADALFAQELDDASKEYVYATLKYYPDQKDAKEFLDRISLRHAPTISTHDYRSSDKGGNVAYNWQIAAAFDIISPLRINVEYRTRRAENKNEGTKARNDNYVLGARWHIMPSWILTASLNNAVLKGNTSNNHVLGDIATEFKIAQWHTLELRFRTDIQNFTADLINSNISMRNYIATYNLNTPFKMGLYAQYYYTAYSDKNTRNLLFASLYYNFMADPVVKAGVNFNTMHFSDQVPLKYFSPSKFSSYELFATIENLEIPKKKWLYQAFIAGGYQQIEKESDQAVYRFTLSLGYRPVNNLEAFAYYLYSNSASSTVVGYTYSEVGLKAKWILKRLYK